MPKKTEMAKKSKKEKEVKEAVITEVDSKEVQDVVENIDTETIEKGKAYFFPRVIAYLIDIFIVSIVASLIVLVMPENENYQTYLEEYEIVQTEFMEEKITASEYMNRAVEIIYDMDYSNVLTMIIEVVIIILYFIVFQFYNKGQTFGKQLMKIRVISTDGNPVSMDQYICRALVIHSVAANILIIGMILFIHRDIYYYCSFFVQGLQMLLIFISVMMMIYSKTGKGLHDKFAHTQVVMDE